MAQLFVGPSLLQAGPGSSINLAAVLDSNNHLAIAQTKFTQTPVGLLLPEPADASGYVLGKQVGRNAVVASGSVSFAASAASGNAQTASVSLPSVLQKDALYLVSLMNPTGTPQGLSATVASSGSVGSHLATSTTYYYAVSTVGPWGETLICSPVSAAEGSTAYPIGLAWSSQGGATEYKVYKGTSSTVDYLASTSSTSYTDSGNTATSSTAPPTTSTQGPGTSVTVAFQDAQTFGTSTTYYAEVTSIDVADGVTQAYLVQGWLLGDAPSQIQVSLDNGASDQAGDVWYEVTQV